MGPMAAGPAQALSWQAPVRDETPCVRVDTLAWEQPDRAMPHAIRAMVLDAPGYLGQCLGVQSLERLRHNLDRRLLAAGFITTRVTLPPQDLSTGTLLVRPELGRVKRIVQRGSDGSAIDASLSWLPVRPGDVLNLRDIEQAVENAQRLPSWAIQVAIEPAEEPGASNLVLVRRGGPAWRTRASIDNQALQDFGRWQLTLHTGIDVGWLGADQLSLWHQRSATGLSPARLQHRSSVNYSLAWGPQILNVGVVQGGHRRQIEGTTVVFAESAEDTSAQAQWQRVLHRSASTRLSASLAVHWRRSSSFIEDTELLLQRRRSLGWESGLAWHWRDEDHSATLSVQRKRVHDNDPRIELLPEAPAKPRRDSLDIDLQRPVVAVGAVWNTGLSLRWVRDPAYGADLAALGGPGTVRGFDGSRQVVGLRSAVWRQDWLFSPAALRGGAWQGQWALGLDLGQVGDIAPESRTPHRERRLVGFQLALRAQRSDAWLSAELAWAKPLRQPRAWPSASGHWTVQLSSAL
jgi:hemolysin activation/secretion protein